MGNQTCPRCESDAIRPSRRFASLGWLYRVIRCQPYRCLCCRKHFFLALPPDDGAERAEINARIKAAALAVSAWLRFKALTAAGRIAPAMKRTRYMKHIRYASAVGLALVCVYFVAGRRRPWPSNPLSLTVEGRAAYVRIAWDRSAPIVRDALKGSLELSEGDGTALSTASRTTRIELDRDLLRTGTVVYARKSQNVLVHMQVGDVEEMAAFVSAWPPVAENEQATREAEITLSKLHEQAEQIRRLEQIVERLEPEKKEPAVTNVRAPMAPLAISSMPKKAVGAAPENRQIRREAETVRSTTQQEAGQRRLEQRVELRQYPQTVGTATVLPVRTTPAREVPAPVLLTPPAIAGISSPLAISSKLIANLETPAAPPAGAHPRTGTLIWTGKLSKNGIISIDGHRPSTGALTGEVPGFPVRVNVYPADLTSDGLRVYTADPKYPADYFEPPGQHNGWNRTSYVQDPRRAGAVTVLEPPRSENGWKRMVLQAGPWKVSVVLVEWGAIL